MRDEPMMLEELQRPLDQLRAQLRDKGWTDYKSQELRDPTEQWTIRTGYCGGETYLHISRYSRERADLHVSSIDPYGEVAYLRLWPRMAEDPATEVRAVLAEAGVPL